MIRERNRWLIFILILLIIAAGIGGFWAGKSAESSKYRAERELNVLLNRSELEGLGEIEGTVYVTGHKSPDSDTVGSSIAYAVLLQKLGYDARPVVLGDINNETKFILESAKLDVPELMEDASGSNMILVDHSEYIQSADGLQNANIVSIIDHHGDGSVTTGNQLIYDARPLGSTATIIWIRYRNYGLEPDGQTALVMMGAILSDTKNLMSKTTTYADSEALKALSGIAGISDIDAFYQKMYEASISYDGMTPQEIFKSDYKEYESGGKKYAIGCINAYDEQGGRDMAKTMKELFLSLPADDEPDMAFAQINIFNDGVDVTYIVPSDEAAAEVIEAAFGDSAVFDGTAYRLEPGISRKQVLVPAITDVLAAYPKE